MKTTAPTQAIKPSGKTWTGFRRSAVFMVLLCTGIAAMLTVMDNGGFKEKLVYSFSIGSFCWLIIDGGRHALAALLNRLRVAKGQSARQQTGFPGWGWLAAIIVLGMGLGPILGSAAANVLMGNRQLNLSSWGSRGSQVTIIVAVLASIVSLVVLSSLERLSAARAQAEAAQRAAAENQLKLLESQLEPHMLFNTLANLRVLIALDAPKAQLMLDQLIGFLRGTLGASRVAEHALSLEFARLNDYLALLKVRMGERLQVRFDLPVELQDVSVAPLLLQPLVENSIKHGLEPHIDGGRVEISARVETSGEGKRKKELLVLRVRDTGRGLSDAAADMTSATTTAAANNLKNNVKSESTHFGLQQVRDRLNALYQGEASFTLENAPITASDNEGGTVATIRLPLNQSANKKS